MGCRRVPRAVEGCTGLGQGCSWCMKGGQVCISSIPVPPSSPPPPPWRCAAWTACSSRPTRMSSWAGSPRSWSTSCCRGSTTGGWQPWAPCTGSPSVPKGGSCHPGSSSTSQLSSLFCVSSLGCKHCLVFGQQRLLPAGSGSAQGFHRVSFSIRSQTILDASGFRAIPGPAQVASQHNEL